MKPPFAYYGGKSGMARMIASLLPPHRVYLEPFFGSGAVLFAKAPARHEVINDLDGNVVTFFQVLRDRRDELIEACALTPHAREEFDRADFAADVDDVERARRFWVRVNQSFAKSAGQQTGWSVTASRTQSIPASIAGRLGRFAAVAERLMACSIECCDAAGLVERLATEDTAIYADPPYLASTRQSRLDRQRPADYGRDMGDEDSHRRLAAVLTSTPATVILSSYASPLYDELYAGWSRIDIPVTVHSSMARSAGVRGARVEVLWCNRLLDAGRLPFAEEAG